jgi:hypothetical protein
VRRSGLLISGIGEAAWSTLNRGFKSSLSVASAVGMWATLFALSERSGMSTAPRAQAFRPGLRVRRMLSPLTVRVMDQAVEDGVGVGDQGVPLIDRELAGDDGGAAVVAILEDLQQVVAGGGVERLEAPVVEDKQIDAAEGAQQTGGGGRRRAPKRGR